MKSQQEEEKKMQKKNYLNFLCSGLEYIKIFQIYIN